MQHTTSTSSAGSISTSIPVLRNAQDHIETDLQSGESQTLSPSVRARLQVVHAKYDFSTTTASIATAPTGVDASCHGASACKIARLTEHFIFARFVCCVLCVLCCVLCVVYCVLCCRGANRTYCLLRWSKVVRFDGSRFSLECGTSSAHAACRMGTAISG